MNVYPFITSTTPKTVNTISTMFPIKKVPYVVEYSGPYKINGDNTSDLSRDTENEFIDEMDTDNHTQTNTSDLMETDTLFVDYIQNINIKIPDLSNIEESKLTILETGKFLEFLKKISIDTPNMCYLSQQRNDSQYGMILFNYENYLFEIFRQTSDNIESCLTDPNTQLIIIPIGITHMNLQLGHLNIVIIDKYRKSIEYFEPLGYAFNDKYLIQPFSFVTSGLVKLFPILNDFKIYNSSEWHSKGVQSLEEYSSNFCGTWCMYIIFLRILNNDLIFKSPENITQILNRFIIDTNNIKIDHITYSDTMVVDNKFTSLIQRFLNMIDQKIDTIYLNYPQRIDTLKAFIERKTDNDKIVYNRIDFLAKKFIDDLERKDISYNHFYELFSLKHISNNNTDTTKPIGFEHLDSFLSRLCYAYHSKMRGSAPARR